MFPACVKVNVLSQHLKNENKIAKQNVFDLSWCNLPNLYVYKTLHVFDTYIGLDIYILPIVLNWEET